MTDSIDDYISKLRTVSLSELESVLVEIENLQDPTLFRELLNSVVWIPAERRDRDEIYMRGFGRLEIPFSDRFSARVARPEWQQFIALRLLCSSPIHQELRRSLVHLSPPRINLSGLNLPDFSRLPNLRSLHLYLDHEPLKPAVLALLNLEELSLFGPGFRSLEGVEKADRLRELDLRWQDSPSLEPLRDKRELKHANLVFHQGTLDLAPLASTTLERAWIFGPDLRTEELLNAPRLRELKVTTEGSFELGSATSKLETLECDRSTSITLREAPCLREILVIGGYPDGVRLEVLHPLPSLELLELIAYSDPPPPLTLCPALRYLRVRPYQVDTFKRLPGLEACSQLREVELWEPFPTIPELKDLPRLQRIEPRVKEKEDFDTRTRSTIDFDEFGEGLESIFHSETDLEEARSKLQEWLALDGRPEFLDQLLQECRLLSSGQVWVPPGSYLRGHPDERWQTCAWSDRPQNTASERRA
ncbi:MAG: hypothetical protein KC800_16490, partial [Candidatus Eremiobacteraeota bacterium]|nr:hypothetical protein [Candidatus Eremiobacteraeota bacterium]